jgi:hypothetical protein
MKNLVFGLSRINKDFLGVRPPVLVRLPRVETAYPIHRLISPLRTCDTGKPVKGGFLLSNTLAHRDVIGLFAPDRRLSCIVLRADLDFMGAATRCRNVKDMILRVLASPKNRKTSIAGVRHS